MKENQIITIETGKYLTNELAVKIAAAQWHSTKPEWVNRIRESIYLDSYFYDCFCVVATNSCGDVVGRLYCIQNENDKSLWYYGDLFVAVPYRRMGIAGRMIRAAVGHLSEINAKRLRCYVEPENTPSIALQKSMGFCEKNYEPFNNPINDGQLMFELEMPASYSAIPAAESEARFITMFYSQNMAILHGGVISFDEWKRALSSNDLDEQHFLICRGCMPVAWLKINGLQSRDIAWISMLAVSTPYQRQGAGMYAVKYAEEFIRAKGIAKVGIRTTDDNAPAQNLYRKCGYAITKRRERTTGDGVQRMEYTFEKEIQPVK